MYATIIGIDYSIILDILDTDYVTFHCCKGKLRVKYPSINRVTLTCLSAVCKTHPQTCQISFTIKLLNVYQRTMSREMRLYYSSYSRDCLKGQVFFIRRGFTLVKIQQPRYNTKYVRLFWVAVLFRNFVHVLHLFTILHYEFLIKEFYLWQSVNQKVKFVN